MLMILAGTKCSPITSVGGCSSTIQVAKAWRLSWDSRVSEVMGLILGLAHASPKALAQIPKNHWSYVLLRAVEEHVLVPPPLQAIHGELIRASRLKHSGTKVSKHLAATHPSAEEVANRFQVYNGHHNAACRLYGQRRSPNLAMSLLNLADKAELEVSWNVWMWATLWNTLIWTTAKLQAAKLTVHQTPDQPHLKTAHHLHVSD